MARSSLSAARHQEGEAPIKGHATRWCDSFPRDGACKFRGCGARKEESDLDNLMTDGGLESHPPR